MRGRVFENEYSDSHVGSCCATVFSVPARGSRLLHFQTRLISTKVIAFHSLISRSILELKTNTIERFVLTQITATFGFFISSFGRIQ